MDRIFEHKPTLGIHDVFQAAKSTTTYDRLMKLLFSIYSKKTQAQFIMEFLQCIAISLTHMEKHPSVENVLDFAASYCIYHGSLVSDDEDVLLLAVFEFIFDNHNRKFPGIRFRACEFVNRILNKMGPQASLDDDVFEKMAATMLERLQDKMPSIRAQAVFALQRLQDPPNRNCRIIKAFMYHMETDPSCEVRARVVQNIAVTQRTLPAILARLQDSKDTVRKEAYRALTRLKPHKFTIHQRQTILTSGFEDRSDSVKTFVKNHVLPSWFDACSNNLLDFLSMLDVVSFKADLLTTILSNLFAKYASNSELKEVIERLELESEGKKVIPLKKLTPEIALLWSASVKHLGIEECEGVIVPELTQFARYIASYTNESDLMKVNDQYILTQLIEITKLYSFSDEMGRKQLIDTCVDALKNDGTGVQVVSPIVKLLELLVPNTRERLAIMAELISDIREPLDESIQNNGELDWEAKSSPQKENIDPIEGLTENMSQLHCQSLDDGARAERTDPETLIKCLTVIVEMLKAESVTKIDPTLHSLKEHFIIMCLKSDDGRVVSLALDAISLLGVWSLDLAKEYFLQFCIQITNDAVCVSALEAVFDMLIIHGFEPFSFGCLSDDGSNDGMNDMGEYLGEGFTLDFSSDPTFTPTTRRIVPLLASLLKSNVREVKCKVCEGLTKLLMSSRLDSPIVLAHLVILWFSPDSDTEPVIRQSLGLFFGVFSSSRIGAPDIIISAFSPTLRAIEALHDEEIDMIKVANLFVTLLRHEVSSKVGKSVNEKGSYHGQLGLIILDEIRQEVIGLPILAKALSNLELESCDEQLRDKLLIQAQRTFKWLSKRSGDKRIINVVKKFKEELEKLKEQQMDKADEKQINAENSDMKDENKENKDSNGHITESVPTKRDHSASNSAKAKTDSVSSNEKIMKNRGKFTVLDTRDSDLSNISGVERLSSIIEVAEENQENEGVVSDSEPEKNETSDVTENPEQGTSGSSDIFEPSPPKRRTLRSCRRPKNNSN